MNALDQTFTLQLKKDEIKQALDIYESALLNEYSTLVRNKLGLLSMPSYGQTSSHIVNT
jgi:uncharacterized protein YdiU (UPF0061 family)